jgi:hypothetical protein
MQFTISGAANIMACRYPYRLEVCAPAEVAPDEDCIAGSDVHDGTAKYINGGGKLPDHDLGPVWASALAWIQHEGRSGWVAEPAYAWDPVADTARRLGVDIGRTYALHGMKPHEIGGTLDVEYVDGDTIYVYEFGTGHDVSHKHEQMRLQCAVAALAHGCTRAVGQVVRFADDGAYPSQPVELDEFALAAIRGEFAELLSQVEGSEPAPGDHCSRCSLAPVCPAAASIVQALIPAEALVKPGWGLTIASPDHAAWLLNHARLVKAAAEAVKDAVDAYVPKEGLVLADGSLLVPSTRNMPRFDNARLKTLAVSMGATPEQIEACNYVAVENAGLKIRKPTKAKRKRAA